MAIDAFTLQGHPKRTEVAFFKYMGTDAKTLGFFYCRPVDRTPITEKDLIGNTFLLPDRFQPCGQTVQRTSEMRCTGARQPERQIPCIEVNFEYAMARCAQGIGKAGKEWRCNSLQQQ